MKLDAATVRQIAQLAHLELDEREVEQMRAELGAILGYVEALGEGTQDPAPASSTNRFRVADTRVVLSEADKLRNASDHEDGAFRVPKVI